MKGTQLRQGWGQGIQVPSTTGDISSKHKSNAQMKPVWPCGVHGHSPCLDVLWLPALQPL